MSAPPARKKPFPLAVSFAAKLDVHERIALHGLDESVDVLIESRRKQPTASSADGFRSNFRADDVRRMVRKARVKDGFGKIRGKS